MFVIVAMGDRPVASLEARDGELWPGRVPLPGPRGTANRLSVPAEVASEVPAPAEDAPVPSWWLAPSDDGGERPDAEPAGTEDRPQTRPASRRPLVLPLRR